jgi:hypothetical protein
MNPVVLSYYCHKCGQYSTEKPVQTTDNRKAFFWCPKCWFIHMEEKRILSEKMEKKNEESNQEIP